MQNVPIDKILIQPTVQFQWLKQHGKIEFSLPEVLLRQYEDLWLLYCAQQPIEPVNFLQQTTVDSFDLSNNDLLFALFTGASYALAQNASFQVKLCATQMTWEIDN